MTTHEHDPADPHHHHSGPQNFDRAFAIGITLNTGFVIVEAIYGVLSNSLALLADAGHNLSDVLALLLAWGASVWVRQAPTARRTYGFRRSSILVALLNAVILLVAMGSIAWEAVQRFALPEPVVSGTVVLVASIGIVINGLTAWLFTRGQQSDVNIRGAYLHMVADAAVSFGVVLSAVVMYVTQWARLDAVISMVVVITIVYSTWQLLRESLDLALDAVPERINPAEVEAYLSDLPGIEEVHDLHIWSMSTTEVALTAHLVKPDGVMDDALLSRINKDLRERFGIAHTTVQLEQGSAAEPCRQASASVL